MSYQIKTDYNSTTRVSSVDLNLRGDILQAQLPGAFESLGIGVLRATDLQVGTSAVAPGGAIIRNEAGVPIYVRVPNALPIPARGNGEYLHLVLRVPEFEDGPGTNSTRGAAPVLRVSEDEEEPDALLLAQWDGTKWADRRPRSNMALLEELQDDVGYDDDARGKGTVNERIERFENADPTDPDATFNAQVAFIALQIRVAQNEAEIAKLKAQAATGTQDVPQSTELAFDHIALLWAGLAEVNPAAIERAPVAVVVKTAGHGQFDTPDFSPDTDPHDPRELPWNPDGTFGP